MSTIFQLAMGIVLQVVLSIKCYTWFEFDTITSESKNISGWGDIKSKVTITVGKKKYKCQADKDSYFSRKIKPQKVGTKIKVAKAIK